MGPEKRKVSYNDKYKICVGYKMLQIHKEEYSNKFRQITL